MGKNKKEDERKRQEEEKNEGPLDAGMEEHVKGFGEAIRRIKARSEAENLKSKQ